MTRDAWPAQGHLEINLLVIHVIQLEKSSPPDGKAAGLRSHAIGGRSQRVYVRLCVGFGEEEVRQRVRADE